MGLALRGLTDKSKLVRWRSARILGELGGDDSVLAALKQAQFSDSKEKEAFEVAFEMGDAARRVRRRVEEAVGGEGSGESEATAAAGPMWKQIQNGIAQNKDDD